MNLQGKLSGLRGLVSHAHSKRRCRGDLSADMISPPLGDFRHTMHVGRGGDVFGDTSFLSNHGGTAGDNGSADVSSTPDNKIGAFFSRTLRQVRKGSDSRPREGPKDLSPPPPAVSPIIKNAISLPRLDLDLANGSPPAKALFPSSTSSPEESRCAYGLESGFVTLPRLSRAERQQPSDAVTTVCSPDVHRGSLTDVTDAILSSCATLVVTADPNITMTTQSDSLLSLTSLDTFTFDLGPSLMSEVFSLIDSPESHLEASHNWESEEAGSACGLTNEGSEKDSATISYVDSLLREDCSYGVDLVEEEGRLEVNGVGHLLKGAVPDVLLGSPGEERPGFGMESESFQNAACLLARHYGVGGVLKGQSRLDVVESGKISPSPTKKKPSYSYVDEEEEIKV